MVNPPPFILVMVPLLCSALQTINIRILSPHFKSSYPNNFLKKEPSWPPCFFSCFPVLLCLLVVGLVGVLVDCDTNLALCLGMVLLLYLAGPLSLLSCSAGSVVVLLLSSLGLPCLREWCLDDLRDGLAFFDESSSRSPRSSTRDLTLYTGAPSLYSRELLDVPELLRVVLRLPF